VEGKGKKGGEKSSSFPFFPFGREGKRERGKRKKGIVASDLLR